MAQTLKDDEARTAGQREQGTPNAGDLSAFGFIHAM